MLRIARMLPAIGTYVLTSHRTIPTTINATATFIIFMMPFGTGLSLFEFSISTSPLTACTRRAKRAFPENRELVHDTAVGGVDLDSSKESP